MYMERYRYALKTEISQCFICKKWIDDPREICIINHKHYHINCMARINELFKLLRV